MAIVNADFEQRAIYAENATLINRVKTAATAVAISVMMESPAIPDNAARVRLAASTLREATQMAIRLAVLITTVGDVKFNDVTLTTTLNMTDAQIQALIDSNWTLLSVVLMPAL